MEQICYKVVLYLLNNDTHIRQIARDIKSNHMTVKRTLIKLEEEGVVDTRIEGKNYVYFLKKSIQARNYVLQAEIYKKNELLNKHPELIRTIEELEKLKSKLIIIFGSYSSSKETDESDIDLFVESTNNKNKKRISQINFKLSVKLGKFDKQDLLIKEIIKNHVIIKGFERYYSLLEKTS